MIIQHGTRETAERVWVAVYNSEGATMTGNWPAMRILSTGNASSVGSAVEAALPTTARGTGAAGGVIGVVDDDIANEDVGLVQVYGYRASFKVADLNSTLKTVDPGTPIGQVSGATVGFSSAPVDEAIAIALDTITGAQHSGALGGDVVYGNHIFIRAL